MMHKFLIIRPGALGDALLTFPVLQALRAHYQPEPLEITLVSHTAVLALAKSWGIAEQVEDYTAIRWSELFLETGIRSHHLKALLAGTELALCWLSDEDGLVKRNLLGAGCHKVICAPGRPSPTKPEHILRYLAATINLQLQLQLHLQYEDFQLSEISPFKLSSGLTPLESRPGTSKRRTVAIHPGSGGPQKCWPIENFARLIVYLHAQKMPVILLAGPADQARLQALQTLLPSPISDLRILENRPLLELCQEFAQCYCYVGNDAGITHLAALYGLPTIALFGPSDPRIWRPVGPQVKVIIAPQLAQLPVTRIISTIESLSEGG